MITNSANALSDEILKRAKENSDYANMYAVSYAKSDDISDKALYLQYAKIEETYRQMHTLVCQGLHAVEREMREIVDGEES